VEAKLAELWERVLGTKGISVTADFFDVGGHSLLAAQLLAQVAKVFGRKVPLAVLLQSPTIESLAAQLRPDQAITASDQLPATSGGGEAKWAHPGTQVFPMRREGNRPPLILVDAGPFHRPLVRSLGSDQPVLGVGLPELSALPSGFTVKEIAANLVTALEEAEVDGPYCLAGWSHAGTIAYEMAQQLRSRGNEIALLILLDTNNPAYLRSFNGWKNYPIRVYLWLEKVLFHLRKLRGMPLPKAISYFRERMEKFKPERIEKQKNPGAGGEEASVREIMDLWKVQYLAARGYQPKPCDWPVVLARSEALQSGWFRDPRLGWGDVARGGLQVVEMPGEHDAMFLEPDVQQLGSILQQYLKKAAAAKPTRSSELISAS
jgi:thioesterase domain-containing protein